jgi:hypothetical protein
VRDHSARAHQGLRADGYTSQDGGVAANRGAVFYARVNKMPVRRVLHPAIVCRGTREKVIRKHDPVPDKNLVFYGDAFANKRMRRYFAARADDYVTLNFDKGADGRLVANGTAVEIDQLWQKNTGVIG